ncbi:hypothetical protein JW921_06750 [Candidatus Fermentibacterales bacterium]|nr:hypothetical protein [Candidatus Fermentibacterales bacterium]
MRTEVRREGGKVWLEGISGFSPADCASSVHGAQARMLRALGDPLSYEDLVCYGGFAFRVCVHERMCPSAAHPACGFDCIGSGLRAIPWRGKVFEIPPAGRGMDDRESFEAEAYSAVRDSIDRGVPVQYTAEEDGLIIGYADEGRRWWCLHPYHEWGEKAFWHDEADGFSGGKWPWMIGIWTDPVPEKERVPARDLTLAALQQAVEMWKAGKRDEYYLGDAAYGHWLAWLEGVDSGAVEDPSAGMRGNGWCFDVLTSSRRIAGEWLGRKAAGIGGDAGRYLGSAAECYRRISEICSESLRCSWDLAPGPERAGEWDSELRRQQMSRLESSRRLDGGAIDAIAAALRVLR